MTTSPAGATYASAGVDIEAGEKAVALMKASVERTSRSEVRGGIGGFAGLFDLDLSRYPRPVLASSTDGVGTKIAIARELDRHDTIGIDLVAMIVDDLVVVGAEPLFLNDYIATGRVDPDRIALIVEGIARGCEQAGCALLGGETAEHPGLMAPDEYDISGTGVGVVDADDILGPQRVQAGDVLIALGSSGLHANGFSLVRQVLRVAGLALSDRLAELGGRTLGDELLTPTRIYALDCLALAREVGARAFAHITGGGIAGNLARILPPHLDAVVDRSTWTPQPIFGLLAARGDIATDQLELTFNLGIGMIAVVAPERESDALALASVRRLPAWTVGSVAAGAGKVELTGRVNGSGPTEAD